MSISFDAAYSDAETGDSDCLFDATVAEANSIMLFFAANKAGFDFTSQTVRFNSVDATYIGQKNQGGNTVVGAWYLLNPDTGTHTVSFGWTGNLNAACGVCIYKLPKLSGQPDSSATDGSDAEATWNLSTTVVLDNSWVVGAWSGTNSATASSGTVERIAQADVGGSGFSLYVGDSNGPKAPGSTSLEYTNTGTPQWAGIIVSIAPEIFRSKIISFNEAYI